MDRLEVRMTLPSYVRFAKTHRVGSEGQDDLSHADSRGSFAGRGDLREHGAKIMFVRQQLSWDRPRELNVVVVRRWAMLRLR